jgi:hypothetical protein
MKKYFNDNELKLLPLLYGQLYFQKYYLRLLNPRSIQSAFHQNLVKEKQRQIAKPVSRLFDDEDIC